MAEMKVYHNRNFQIVCGAGLSSMMMVVIIAPAFPKMVEALGVSEQSIGLLITLICFPMFLFGPLAGIMADRIGRKRLLVPSVLLFGIFGGGCALAPDFNTLLILRTLQGIAGAGLGGGVTGAIVGDLFSGQKRAEAMGLYTTVVYCGYIIYPVLGGALAGLAWNYVFLPFLIAIPLGIIALFFLHCPEPKTKQNLKDYLRDALLHLKSLKVLWLFSASIIGYVLLYGAYLTYFSLLLGGLNASPFTIGLFVSIVGLLTAIASSQLGRFSKRFSLVQLIMGAFFIYFLAMAITPLAPNLWLCILPTILFGIAHGLNLPSQRAMAAGVAPLEHRAGFMAIQSAMISLGMTIGPLIMGLVFILTSLHTTFIIAGVIALIIPIMAIIIGREKLSV